MPCPLIRPTLLLLLATLVAFPATRPGAARAADVGGPQLVAFLNAQRAAHGIPAGIAEDPALSDGCTKHNRYGAANGMLVHGEDPASPAYTPEGDAAARTAVLYRGQSWAAGDSPFEFAPIHLHQLLAPYLDRAGADETAGYGCITTLASVARPSLVVDTLFTYPGDGTRDWRASETVRGDPSTPAPTVGIPAGTRTGPTLYVMASGPGLRWGSPSHVVSASLTGPGGPVQVVTFDRSSPEIGAYLPTGAQLLPRAPLQPAATYTAAIVLQVTGDDGVPRDISRTWSFTTAAAAEPARTVAESSCTTALRYAGLRRQAGLRRLRVRATACRAAVLRVVVRRAGRVVLRRSVRLPRTGTHVVSVTLPRRLRAGRYAVRATVAGATLSFSARLPAAR
jgi:hypothetical protein